MQPPRPLPTPTPRPLTRIMEGGCTVMTTPINSTTLLWQSCLWTVRTPPNTLLHAHLTDHHSRTYTQCIQNLNMCVNAHRTLHFWVGTSYTAICTTITIFQYYVCMITVYRLVLVLVLGFGIIVYLWWYRPISGCTELSLCKSHQQRCQCT